MAELETAPDRPEYCCSPAAQESCCTPDDKGECCGPDREVGSCGCRHRTELLEETIDDVPLPDDSVRRVHDF